MITQFGFRAFLVAMAVAMTTVCSSPVTWAQPTPDGGEFQVNTYTPSYEGHPDVAMDAAGNFIITWVTINPPDDDLPGIRARLFSSDGQASSDEFRVHSTLGSIDLDPVVDMNGEGASVVVWERSSSVRAQRLASDGSRLGAELQVGSGDLSSDLDTDVLVGSDGSFVVAWSSDESDGDDSAGASIQVRRFASDGSAAGSQIQVNTYTSGDQTEPALTALPGGGFLVVWDSVGSAGGETGSGMSATFPRSATAFGSTPT